MTAWGIIGCGDVTEVKSGPALQQARGSSLVAVMRRDGAKAADYARRHGVPRWYDDADALIHDPGVEAVYVATPPSTHAHYAIAAMRAGKPVYVEKPMALDGAECDAMLAVSRATGMPLFVAYYRRALPRFAKVRELLAVGAIGAPRRVRVQLHRTVDPRMGDPSAPAWRVRPEISGGGLFVDLGSHTLDLLDFLLGPIRNVSGEATSAGLYPAEDTVRMAFGFAGGVEGSGDWCFHSDARRDLVEIEGEAGRLRFATFDEAPVELVRADGTQRFTIANPRHIQLPLVERVVAQLRGEGLSPSTGESAARATRVIDAALAGYRRARAPQAPLG
ncbi:Gfo/Idh/MocA family protein [Luteimonas sp. SDU82]|uniref:Gfo/Idh/MocA family protein n=1 Tax=Luteimonas sp. SDU82 TaxID=3422592 RepID=UPI003EB83646